MITSYDELIAQIEEAGLLHVEKKQVANRYEELKKVKLSSLKRKYAATLPKHSESLLESLAYADPEMERFIIEMVNARAEADKQEIRYDALKNYFDAQRSHMAFEREKLNKGIV